MPVSNPDICDANPGTKHPHQLEPSNVLNLASRPEHDDVSSNGSDRDWLAAVRGDVDLTSVAVAPR